MTLNHLGNDHRSRSSFPVNSHYAWLILTLACVIVGCLIYLPSLNLYPSMDALHLLAYTYELQTWWDIFRPVTQFWRPLQELVIVVNAKLLGFDSFWLIRAIQILGHGLNVFLVINIGRKMHLSPQAVFLGGILFAVQSINSVPLLQTTGTLSQTYSVVFVLVAYYFWVSRSWTSQFGPPWLSLAIGLASLLALLWKETAIGPILGIGALALISSVRSRVALSAIIRFLVVATIMPLVIYLVARWLVGGAFQMAEGRYHLSLGANVVKNVGMLLGGLMYQGSTLDIFPAINPGRFTLGLTLTALLLAWLGWSLWLFLRQAQADESQLGYLAGTVMMLFASFFPVVLNQRVGEVYIYNAAPFGALTLILLLDRFLYLRQPVLVGLLLFSLLALAQVIATLDKQTRVVAMGELSRHYVQQACKAYADLPPDTTLCWQSGQPYEPAYGFLVQDHASVYSPVNHFCASVSANDVKFLDARDQIDQKQCTYFVSERASGELIFEENK
jgi:hypothetical protein